MPYYQKPDNWASPYEPGHVDPKVCAFIDVLQDFFLALEQGTAHLRLPDPAYERRRRKPQWTEAELASLVKAIDDTTDRELSWASRNPKMRCDAGPGFSRLTISQRLALAQNLDQVLAKYDVE